MVNFSLDQEVARDHHQWMVKEEIGMSCSKEVHQETWNNQEEDMAHHQ